MEQFVVYLDQKVEVWTRQTFFVNAENNEQAIELAKAKEGEPDNFEYLSDSECILSPEENDNQATEEWVVNDETIETNAPEE